MAPLLFLSIHQITQNGGLEFTVHVYHQKLNKERRGELSAEEIYQDEIFVLRVVQRNHVKAVYNF